MGPSRWATSRPWMWPRTRPPTTLCSYSCSWGLVSETDSSRHQSLPRLCLFPPPHPHPPLRQPQPQHQQLQARLLALDHSPKRRQQYRQLLLLSTRLQRRLRRPRLHRLLRALRPAAAGGDGDGAEEAGAEAAPAQAGAAAKQPAARTRSPRSALRRLSSARVTACAGRPCCTRWWLTCCARQSWTWAYLPNHAAVSSLLCGTPSR